MLSENTILVGNLANNMVFYIAVYYTYCMAGNFRGVLIFVIFVVDLAVTKISTHEN